MQIKQCTANKKSLSSNCSVKSCIFTDYLDTVQSVSIVFLIGVGGLHETESNYGISHFLEHMSFKGTKNLNYQQIARKFDQMGGDFNAYTAKDRTVFSAKVLKNKAKDAIDILHEIIFNSILPEEEVEKERNVILQEIKQNEESYENYIFDMHYKNAYQDQPIGQDLLGSREFIKEIKKSQLHEHMQSHYRRNNVIVGVSGNFDEKEIVSYIEEKLYDHSNGRAKQIISPLDFKRKLPKSIYTPQSSHKNADIEQNHAILGFEGVDYDSDLFYVQSLASIVLGDGMFSRLFQKIREERGLAYSISSFTNSLHDTGTLGVHTAADPSDIDEITKLTIAEIENLACGKGKLEDELEIAKNIALSSFVMSMESTATRAEKIVSNHFTFGRFIPFEEVEKSVNNITTNDISQYFEKIVLQSSPTFVSIGSRISIGSRFC